ncbi:MFS transporter [Kribbella albertanoniae]|uniref:MFS transporter n=1 Tax=Kribbella albertanoniae TaxID=1266829 RepID=A0A4V2XMC7_9ACTN|nr:MFS transporter [Kribbella albertanoniae]TDC13796.1 MFS transporter [Kribbella albertanoniae]
MSWRQDLAVLRHRDVRLFITSRFVSILGSTIAPVALVFAVLDVSPSPSSVGIVLAARSIPNIVFLLVGGVISDRLPRHLVILVANTISGLTQALAAVLVLTGHATIWQLAAIEAVNGAASAFVMPAMAGVLPAIVSKSDLPQAMAISGFARSAAMIGGGAVAGVIVGLTGPGIGLAVDAVTFLLAAALISRLKLPPVVRQASSMITDLREGWSEFASRQWVWVVVLAFGLLNVLYTACYQTLGPVIADRTFGRAGWGVVSACFGAGLVIGGLLMLRLKPRYPLRAGMAGMLLGAPMILCLALFPHVITVAVAAFVMGLGFEIFGIGWETALGQHVPLDKLSRVSSYDMLGSYIANPVGQLTVGYVAAALSVKAVELYGGTLYVLIIIGTLVVPSIWNLRRLDHPPVG